MDTKPCRACAQPIAPTAVKCPHCLSRQPGTFHRALTGKIFTGVCAGLAEHLGVEVSFVRVGFVVAGLLSGGLVVSAYLALWFLTPPSPDGVAPTFRFMDWLSDLFSPKQATS